MCIADCNSAAASLHDRFVVIMPRIVSIARSRFRDLDSHTRDDAVAETIGTVWCWLRRLDERGKPIEPISPIVEMAIRHVKVGRRLAKDESARDAMSYVAARRHGFTVSRLGSLAEAVVDSTRTTPPDLASFRIDFGDWLDSFDSRHRRIVRAMATREPTKDLARRFGVTAGRISQLRREYEHDWARFHGEQVAA